MNARGTKRASAGAAVCCLAALRCPSSMAADAPAVAAGEAVPVLKLAEPDRGGLLGLAEGRLMLWGQGGRMQVRDPRGAWSAVIQLPLDAILQVVPDDAGVLIAGLRDAADGGASSVLLLVDPRGAVRDRWARADLVSSIASQSGTRWATVSGPRPLASHVGSFDPEQQVGPLVDQLVELVAGGKVAPRDKVERNARIAGFSGGPQARARVDCVPTDLAKDSYHFAYCAALAPGGWRKVGVWDRPPLVCGPYLIEVYDRRGSGDLPHRGQRPQLVARRLDDGQVAARSPLAPGHAVACGAPGQLLVGRNAVTALSLPDLKPQWRGSAGRGRVVALARDGDRVWAAMASGAVVAVKIPAGIAGDPRAGRN